MEGDARTGAREGEGSLIVNAICMYTCKDRVGSFDSVHHEYFVPKIFRFGKIRCTVDRDIFAGKIFCVV